MLTLPDDAVIVSIPNCKACNQAIQLYPNTKHISLDPVSSSVEVLEAKKAVTKLKVAGYPVVLNAAMTKIIGYTNPMPKGV